MTKVYLVTMNECNEEGVVAWNGRTIIDKVFTNKKQAIAYTEKMNKEHWKYEKRWFWYWVTHTISKGS